MAAPQSFLSNITIKLSAEPVKLVFIHFSILHRISCFYLIDRKCDITVQ